MLSTKTKIFFWQFDDQELTDPELIDKLLLSLCSNSGISYPHFKLHLLVSELISNAIDLLLDDFEVLLLHLSLDYGILSDLWNKGIWIYDTCRFDISI